MLLPLQRRNEFTDQRRRRDQEGYQCLQQEDSGEACAARDQASATFQRPPQRMRPLFEHWEEPN